MSDNEPEYGSEKFQCPHCQVISQQTWFNESVVGTIINRIISYTFYEHRKRIQSYEQEAVEKFVGITENQIKRELRQHIPANFSLSTCASCSDIAIWVNKEIVYPRKHAIDPPNGDLSEEIKILYLEASKIYGDSPKGATALLRLALQKLLIQIGKDGKNINDDIKELVADGLSIKIQQALDLVRVVGNNAVHPGQIDLDDGSDIALKLFHILNFIANELITKPKELEALYADVVPDETKEHINQRDSSSGT